MRQLCFIKPGQLEWREVPDAKVQSGVEAVVRPLVIGRCDLDVAFVQGLIPMASGQPIGHEVIGEVIDIGDGVTRFKPGDLVVLPSQISCGTCRNCRRGFTGRCESVPFGASYGMGRDGGFGCGSADLVRVPFADAMMFPLPKGGEPVDWIGFTDMALDGYRCVGPQLKERPGARVLVIGGQPAVIGIYAAGIAVSLGAGAVDFYDHDEERLAEAAKFGARSIKRGEAEPEGLYEIVVDSSVEATALIEAFRFTEPEGHVTSCSVHLGELTGAPFMEAYHKGIHFRTGRPNCRSQMEDVAALCCSGHFKPQLIKPKIYDFDDAPEAWADSALRVAATRI